MPNKGLTEEQIRKEILKIIQHKTLDENASVQLIMDLFASEIRSMFEDGFLISKDDVKAMIELIDREIGWMGFMLMLDDITSGSKNSANANKQYLETVKNELWKKI